MTDLANCLLIVTAEVDASVEADWNRWYDDVHLPDALACPGVRAGRRYVSSGEISESDRGQGKRTQARLYTTVYELEVDEEDIGKVIGRQGRVVRGLRALVKAAATRKGIRVDLDVV